MRSSRLAEQIEAATSRVSALTDAGPGTASRQWRENFSIGSFRPFADAAEKVVDDDSGRSLIATIDQDKIPDERLHPKVAQSRRRPTTAADHCRDSFSTFRLPHILFGSNLSLGGASSEAKPSDWQLIRDQDRIALCVSQQSGAAVPRNEKSCVCSRLGKREPARYELASQPLELNCADASGIGLQCVADRSAIEPP
jgi:hypothetical protein